MPTLGEIARACDVGVPQGYKKVMWVACQDCGAERWVLLRKGQPESSRCYKCSRHYPGRIKTVHRGPDHWKWRGGRTVNPNGYVEVWVDPSSPFYPMANKDGYTYEHRLVMAAHLGRCLDSGEEVHHRDGVRDHNDLSNLELLSKSEHAAHHHNDVKALLRRVAALEEQVRRLGGDPHESQAETT